MTSNSNVAEASKNATELHTDESNGEQENSDATVFVVDDDLIVRDSLRWLIESIGIRAQTFASANEFLEAYDPELPGCVVLDVRMPGMSGLELQEEMNQRGHAIPIVIVTGYADVSMAVRAMKNGATEFLRKPYSEQQMLEAVQHAIKRDAEYRKNNARKSELRQRFDTLTMREREVVALVVEGLSSRVIAERLDISQKTVETHRTHIMRKLKAVNVAALTNLYFELKAADG